MCLTRPLLPTHSPPIRLCYTGGVYFTLAFFAFSSLTTTDLLMAERRLVVREVRGEPEWVSGCDGG